MWKTLNGIHLVATLCLHFAEKRCGYFMFTFVIFVMESRFSGKFIFVSENACSFFILAQKPITFNEISAETHKNLSDQQKTLLQRLTSVPM